MRNKLINTWLDCINKNKSEKALFLELKKTLPLGVVAVFERRCNLQCRHCIYPSANSKDIQLTDVGKVDKIIEAIRKIGINNLTHAGRTLRKSHLPILKKHQLEGMSLSLVDNGSGVSLIREIKKLDLTFDEIFISVDGYEKTHEIQRGKGSWKLVLAGLENFPQIAKKISIISTVTTKNYRTIIQDLARLKKDFSQLKNISIATITQPNHSKQKIDLNQRELGIFFNEALKKSADSFSYKYKIKLHKPEELFEIKKSLPKEFRKGSNFIAWKINNLEIQYFPQSIAPVEFFPIDCNGKHVLPLHGVDCHLDDRDKFWEINDNSILSNPRQSYKKVVKKWAKNHGKSIFKEEKKLYEDGGVPPF